MPDSKTVHIQICMGSSCFARGNNRTLQALREYVQTRGLEGAVDIRGLLCGSACSQGPNMVIDGVPYRAVEPGSVEEVLDHHLSARSAG